MKKIIVLLLLLTPLAANAELFELFLKAALIIASPLTGFVFYAALAITAYGEYKSEELRRQAESQRNAAREKYNAGLDDRTITNVSTEAAHVYIYGESRVGSCVVAMIPSGSKDQYQHIIAIHAAHECESFQELYLGKKALGTLDADGFAINSPDYSKTIHAVEDFYTTTHTIDSNFIAGTVHVYQVQSYPNDGTTMFEITLDLTDNIVTVPSPPPYNIYRVEYDYKTSTVRVKKHLGTPGEAADATLIAECPTKWTSLSKLSGYCYTYWRLDLNQQEFQGGLVGIEALLRGKKLYDPRTTTTYWSSNPALALRDYLLGPCCNVPTVDVPDADVITAENICDELISPADALNIAQDYKTLWVPGMSMPPAGFTLNGTANESKIVSAAGPSGINEPVWACVDYDVASDADGGWNAAAVPADCSKGHLLAVLMKTSTNDGISYFGTDPDSSILDLSGGVSSNPYFWTGDLPALNTWYLVVGYLHEIGYGSTDTGISGVYNLAGTRLVAGTEFKAASGKTNVIHRSYHYYNPTGSLAEVQWMARPVIIPCTVAEAPDIIKAMLNGGYRYQINGTVTSDQDQEHVIEQMVQSMAGGIESSTWSMWAGKYVAPTLALVQSDIVGAIAISPGPSQSDVCNGITARFIGPENDYAPTDMPPYVNAAYLYADGREMFMSREYPFTYDSWHCHNLARITVEDMRNGFTVKATFSLKAWDTKVGQRITLTSSVFGFSSKIFRIVARSYSPTGFPELTLKEDAASIWDEADAIRVDATLNSNLPNPFVLDPPSSLTLTSGDNELLIQSDGTIVSRIKAVWGAPTSIYARIARLQFKKVVDSVWIDGPQVDASACLAYFSPVQDLATYDTRIQYLNPQVQTESTWTYGGTHTVIGKSAPPAAFDVFTVLAQPDGTRQYNFGYTTTTKPTDWMGAEIRYVSGSTGSPDWATMTPLQDTDTYYTSSPVELNIPLAGTYTFACKSIDTTGNLSTYKVWSITLPDRRLGDIYDEFFERSEGWTGAKTGCHVQEGNLEANDSITWATSSGTFSGYARWNTTPSSPIYYETPARDFGTIVAGNINSTIDADGTVVQELATSTDGSSWTGWSTAAAPFSTRYLKLRLTVTATGPAPIPLIRQFDYKINAKMETDYINDVVISGLTGSYRIGTGDIRIPLASTYTFIKRTAITIQDSTAGTWTATRIDQTLTYGPRWQFRLNGTLADPAYVDFFIEGFRS